MQFSQILNYMQEIKIIAHSILVILRICYFITLWAYLKMPDHDRHAHDLIWASKAKTPWPICNHNWYLCTCKISGWYLICFWRYSSLKNPVIWLVKSIFEPLVNQISPDHGVFAECQRPLWCIIKISKKAHQWTKFFEK